MVVRCNDQANELKSKDLWSEFLSKGGVISQLRAVSNEQMESIYQYGFGQFETGHYKEALTVFRYLAVMNHRESRYFLAIGLCLSHLDRDSDAVAALVHAAGLNNSDPRPSLAMVECFIKLKSRRLAKSALKEVARILKSNKGWGEERKVASQYKNYLVAHASGENS